MLFHKKCANRYVSIIKNTCIFIAPKIIAMNITCKHCNKAYSTDQRLQSICPHCGSKNNDLGWFSLLILLAISFYVGAIILAVLGYKNSNNGRKLQGILYPIIGIVIGALFVYVPFGMDKSMDRFDKGDWIMFVLNVIGLALCVPSLIIGAVASSKTINGDEQQ
jgi:RNA polymerase subunit RPABC4/transcription elongation factor Spt4